MDHVEAGELLIETYEETGRVESGCAGVCAARATQYNGARLCLDCLADARRDTMHELSITESLLEIAIRHAEEADGGRIVQLNIVVGELSSIVDESVQFYWDIVSAGTIAEGAKLHFERVEGRLRCLSCGHEFSLGGASFTCPECRKEEVVIAGGDEFRLESIEVE